MKKSTCKTLLWIGILWVVLVVIISSLSAINSSRFLIPSAVIFGMIILFTILFGLPGWILIIIAITKWNSEKEKRKK